MLNCRGVDVLILCVNINNPKDNILSTVHWFEAAMWNGLTTNTTHCCVLIIYGERNPDLGIWRVSTFHIYLVYSPFALSSPFFPRIMKLTQIWE